jgi:hypothetical protein
MGSHSSAVLGAYFTLLLAHGPAFLYVCPDSYLNGGPETKAISKNEFLW